jgi:hypothetical protein
MYSKFPFIGKYTDGYVVHLTNMHVKERKIVRIIYLKTRIFECLKTHRILMLERILEDTYLSP